jgi:DNA ligase 1
MTPKVPHDPRHPFSPPIPGSPLPAKGAAMKRFAALFAALDATTRTSERTAALTDYFRTAPPEDRLWCVALLSGRRPRRAVTATELREWAAQAAGLPIWLFEEAYAVAGDLAETIALVLPPPRAPQDRSLSDWITQLATLAGQPPETRRAALLAAWDALDGPERFLFTKLITGGFRMGVSRGLMTRALARATGQEESAIAHRLMGGWTPGTTTWDDLTAPAATPGAAQPYPFALASPLEDGAQALGDPADWLAEWKWDGIRGQIIARPGTFALWSRGEELMTDRFPDLAPLGRVLPPGTVLDGEVLAWDAAADLPLPFAALQTRIGRKSVPKSVVSKAPARFLAYDLLEDAGQDLRALPLEARRARLDALIAALPPGLPLAATRPALQRLGGACGPARRRPRAARRRADAQAPRQPLFHRAPPGRLVEMEARPLHRRRGDDLRAGGPRAARRALYRLHLRGPRRRGLVPFTKAYSGLTDAEFAEITAGSNATRWNALAPCAACRRNWCSRSPSRGIQESGRHKSGMALRFPRILRWRRDKPAAEIDSLESLRGPWLQARGFLDKKPDRTLRRVRANSLIRNLRAAEFRRGVAPAPPRALDERQRFPGGSHDAAPAPPHVRCQRHGGRPGQPARMGPDRPL